GLDIGTDKPTPEQRRGVVHHLIDVVEPHEPFSASRYRELARQALEGIRARGRLPIVCGGTGLYLRAFVDDCLVPLGHDPELRARLERELAQLGSQELHRRLARVDPQAAARIHPHDGRRIVRALELYTLSGVPPSRLQQEARARARPLPAIWFGLTRPRPELYRRIDERVDRQVQLGLVEETRRLLASGLRAGHTAMQALGYKEMARYLQGRCSFAQAVDRLKRATRHYARRQWIWFRADPRIEWLDLSAAGSWEQAMQQLAGRVVQRLRAATYT
ncbi:MAG TPA: tRNA (adenosine(37)-N6)-dimethylallyltransferase MiaA, partial [Limnochordales bacterium]